MSAPLSITACYAFFPLEEAVLEPLRAELLAFGAAHDMKGLTLIATEGINGTVSGTKEAIAAWKQMLTDRFGSITFKDSSADAAVFHRWSVKIKPEIVGLKKKDIRPSGKHRHLSPREWQAMIARDDVLIVDTRNDYEAAIGTFRGAIDPKINAFHDFPAFVQRANLPKEKKILMYCTGGIRCEKALLEMESQGYEHVYQLDGGILAYLEQFPDGDFEGECFVFDKRVAVDQHLHPSQRYGLCPHCGHAGDCSITCHCGATQKICATCAKDASRNTCSKRCANTCIAR